MNDFTKEELEEITYCVHFVHGDCVFEEKIQSMIDNYCEYACNNRTLAESHLIEAEYLISEVMCLLEMKGNNNDF
jgi:hypothetical protein